jgi:ubiquinone/menaquinone biosynthesis C-methylase UbiE
MSDERLSETVAFWDRVARDWDIQVGEAGDTNRRLNSDPVLWRFVGEVAGRDVLDAGCGTGYLSRQLLERGARVIAVDVSPRMVEIAREKAPEMDIRVDSCSELTTVADASVDIVVSNYVLMDAPDLSGTVAALSRVLRPGGAAVLIFSHPCFPQGSASGTGDRSRYDWDFCYFEERRRVDPPWGHFRSEFIWFHRPLSAYWKAFRESGFGVEDFDEPRIMPERYELAESRRRLDKLRTRPMSVAFRLRKS